MTDALGNLVRHQIHTRHADPATFVAYDQALERSGLEQQTFNSLVASGQITAHESSTGYRFDPHELERAAETRDHSDPGSTRGA